MTGPLYSCKKFFLVVLILLSTAPIFAATRYSVASGNWNSTSTWSATSGGTAGASVPAGGDNVFLENGRTVTVTANASCASITFTGTGNDATLIINSSVTLTVSGDVTLNNVANSSKSCTVSGTGTLFCDNLIVGSNASPSSNNTTYIHTFNSSIANLNISGNLAINSYIGTRTSRRGNGVFNLASGTISVAGSVTTSNENDVNNSTFSLESDPQTGTLILSGTTPFNLSGTGTNTISLAGTSTLVSYSGTSAQTVYATTYTNLTLSGSGVKTLTGSTVNGILSIEGAATTTGSIPAYGAGSAIRYKGSSSQSTGIELPSTFSGSGGIVIDNPSGVTLSASLTITNTLTLTSGAFNTGANTLTLNGPSITGTPENLTTTSSSGLVFGGTSPGVSIPSSVTNLRNLTINNSNGITVNSDITLSSAGILTLTSGLLNVGSHILSVTNTSASAIVYNNGSFVNVTSGSLQRSFPSGLSGTGNNYLFPIGEGGNYKAINLADINTGAAGPVLRASVSSTGAVTGDNTTIGPVDPRCWSLINTNSGNFTSAKIELFENNLDETKTVGMASTMSGQYSSIGGTLNASSIISSTTLNPGSYFCVGTLWIMTYYSYQTGNWDQASTWTTDPSGTLQTSTTIPGDKDKVFILSGRTVTLTSDVNSTELEITIEAGGFLNLSTSRLTNKLTSLGGQGTLQLASVNFPSVTTNTFIDAGGGTTEYDNSADFILPAGQSIYNNLTINCPGHIATQRSNITLNGDLHVRAGTFRINDNTSATKLNLTINGNVLVDNGTFLTVGNGVTNTAIGGTGGTAPFLTYYLNFHTVIIKGDFTNNGTVKFTNLPYPVYNAFPPTSAGATSGAATVYFQGSANNTVTCNGPTCFYNLIVNKGTDQTYSLTINSSAYSDFSLYGANVLPADGTLSGNPNLRKALWICTGTLILKGSLVIPSLSEGTAANADYYVPSSGALITDGVDVVVLSTADDYREVNTAYSVSAPDNATIGVTKGGFSALDIFGKLQINSGYLSTRESGGLITSSLASGQLIINGGTTDTKQFLSSTGTAAYTQTGGLLILRGRFQRTPTAYSTISNLTDVSAATLNNSRAASGTTSTSGSFDLENTGNIYTVSGGTIRIYDVCGTAAGEQGAFIVKSSSANINVSGGTLEIMPVTGTVLADAAGYLVNTTAPVANFTINRTSSTSATGLSSALVVLNNFSLTSGTLVSNNYNLTIGGNAAFESGTTYTPGTNTTIFNGTSDQILTVNLTSALSLYGLTLNKTAGINVTLAGSQNAINVSGPFNLTLGTLNDGGKTINISGATIYNSGVHAGSGVIVLNGTSVQTIDGNGVFSNLTLSNTNSAAAPVSLVANMAINGNLTFSQDKLFNIGTYNLLLNSSASLTGYSSSRYIMTAGNAGDGGLTRAYSSITAQIFPVGAPTLTPSKAVKYTPATIGFSSAPSVYGSVTVVPVGFENTNTTTKGQSLTYYWRVKSSGFSGIPLYSVTHSFVYGESDVTGTESIYVPAIYDEAAHIWYYGPTSAINTTTNTISDWIQPTNSTNFLDADYTAGQESGFGTPKIYYSRQSGLWTSLSTWSMTGHTVNNPPAVAPGANDIVLIGGQDSVYLSTNRYNANTGIQNCATLQIDAGSALDIGYNPGCTFAVVVSNSSGNGNFRLTTNYNSGATFSFPSGDFSDFNVNRGTTELYTTNATAGTEYYMPTGISSYGNLILSPLGGSNLMFPNNNVTIYGNLITRGQNADSWFVPTWGTTYPGSVPAVAKTITIMGDMDIQGGALIWYQNSNIAQNFIVNGNVKVGTLSSLFVYSGATNQSMAIGGNLINNANGLTNGVSTVSKADFTSIPLTFFGSSSSVISSTAGTPSTSFGNVTVNKGTSQATTLTCNIAGTLTTPSDNWLTLQNGTLIYNRTGNFTISQGTNFTIPATSALVINTPSNVYIANSASNNKTFFLNGNLTILNGGGTVFVGPSGNTANNADIEYSGSGASAIEVQGGNLIVTGQIRRPVASTNGVLHYRQSGGNVVIYGNNSAVTKAKLEVLNDGSEFTMTGGTLSIVQGGGTTSGDLYIRPSSGSVTGGTINFTQTPPAGVVIDAVQSYHLDANIALNNLTITGKTASPQRNATLTLMISPLTLNGSLTTGNSNSTFVANNLNVSLKGDLNNNGTYTHGTNTTTFNGNTQSVNGSSVTNFYNLTVSSASSLTVNNNFTINKNLTITTGILNLSSYRATLNGDLVNNGSYSDDNITGGITLAGSSLQYISGTGLFGLLELNNLSGAKTSSDINMQDNLILTGGVFDINIYELTLGQSSQIPGGPFSVSRMIKSDGVINCPGVRKFFSASPQIFEFPIGVTGKYTPVKYTITSNGSVGYIKVNPINNNHPGVSDPSNVLKYYWQVESSGISAFDATALFQYIPADVNGTESSYVAAWLEFPGNTWHEALPGSSTDNVDESTHQITFVHTSATSITGDYTAGNGDAIPGEVPTYRSNKDGNWSDVSIWTPVGSSPLCPAGGPNGAVVIIDHIVTTDINKIYVFSTTINNRLRVVSPTYGHNFGYVYGNGTLYLENGNLPGGNYSNFTSCSGNGTVEYGGTGSYSIIATLFNSLPNVSFTGTGTRILPNKDLSVCKRLVIDGPALDNSVNNRKLTILGSMERYNTGAFRSGTGAAPLATVTFAGTSPQTLGGPTGNFTGSDKFNNLEINNSSGLTIGTAGAAEIGNQLLLTAGTITTSSSNKLTILNTSPSAVYPSSGIATSYINGPLEKYIINGDSFIYPLGKGSIRGHQFTLTSAAGSTTSFTAEFFTPNSTAVSVAAPIEVTNTGEYWGISALSAAAAKIKIAWDPQSDLTPLVTTNGISDMRVAEYIAGYWTELASAPSGDSYNGDVSTINNITIYATVSNFTTASISGTIARAAFTSGGNVCGTVSGIPVGFTSFHPINLNYTLAYSVDGISQTPLTVTSLPYTMPTPSAGVYKLTGFKFNNGTGTGVVDANEVHVYANPTSSNAGSDQSLCGFSSVTLAGNDPSPYSGLWTIVTGTGGSLVNSSLSNTLFNGVLGNSYTLQWTISNGPCTSADNVIITFPVVASVPGDFISAPVLVCRGSNNNIYTVPNVPGVTYNWVYSGTGQTITGSGNSVSINFGTAASSGVLSVTATNSCGTSSARTVSITIPVADFSYPGTPFCQNDPVAVPLMATDGVTGTFSSTQGLVFASTSTGQIDLPASTPGTYTVTNEASSGDCALSATSPVTISVLTWTGAISTDWNTPANWSCGYVPYPTTHILIPSTVNKPVLSGGVEGKVNNITIDAGSSLTITGNTLQISGAVSSPGLLTSADGTVEMNGTSAQVATSGIFAGNTVRNFTVNNSAGVSLAGPLNVTGILKVSSGTLNSGGFLTLLSSAGQTALIDGSGSGTVAGNVTMQRFLPLKYGYKYISSPFQAATVGELADDIDLAASFPSLYRFDENSVYSGWVSYTNPSDILSPIQGYVANFGAEGTEFTADITGIVNNGPLSATLYNHNNTYTTGFNLIGNPYPSPVDWDAASGWTKTNIDNALYYFRAGTTDEYSGTYSTYINGVSSDGLATGIIPSMQGLFVHVSNGSNPVTGTLSMTNDVRVTDLTHPFAKSAGNGGKPLIRLSAAFAEDTSRTDPVVIYFDDKAGQGFDKDLDALKLYNTDYEVPSLYALGSDGSKLSIDALPPLTDTLCTIPLELSIENDGYVIFKLLYQDEELSNSGISILDKLTGQEQKLSDGGLYRVYLTYGEYSNRFYLNLRSSTTGVPEIPADSELFSVYCSHGILKSHFNLDEGQEGTFSIYNLAGQLLTIKKIYSPGYYEFNPGIQEGIYIAIFTTGNLRSSKKLFISNR